MIEWAAPRRRPLLHQPVVLAALAWLTLIAVAALLAPLLAPPPTLDIDPAHALFPPGPGGPLGSDFLGRSILARLLWGSRWTLQLGLLGLFVTVGLGLPVGLLAGSLGGVVDVLLMRLVDGVLAFPALLLAMAAVTVLGRGLLPVAVAVGLAAAPPYALVARSVMIEMRSQPYVEAAQTVGGSRLWIALRHVLPNAAPSLVAFAATQLGWVLLNGAALSFLGLGAPPGTPEWGMMLAEGRGYLRDAPWASAFPGLALTLTVLAANLLGDRLTEGFP